LYELPTVPPIRAPLTWGTGRIPIVSCWVAVAWPGSVTSTVKVVLPAVVGPPLSWPPGLRLRPSGSVPRLTAHW